MPDFESTQPCCEVFGKIEYVFQWFNPDGESAIRLLPFIEDLHSRSKYKVNFCPSCGKDITGVTIVDD